jgi:hypothetical protein
MLESGVLTFDPVHQVVSVNAGEWSGCTENEGLAFALVYV